MSPTRHSFAERTLGRPVAPHIRAKVKRDFDLRDRIRALIERDGLTQTEIARRFGKQKSLVHRWLSSDAPLTLKTIEQFERLFGEALLEVPALAKTI